MQVAETPMSLELHPLCTLFPRLAGAEFEAMKADIIANGQREPIIVHEGQILDGGNRYRACIEAGIEPMLKDFAGDNAVAFVLSANLHRRHLTPGQQAAIVARAQDWSKAQTNGGDRRSDQSATLHTDTAADRAAQSGASLRTQQMADKVAKASPDLAEKVAHGEISLPKALEQIKPRTAPAADAPAPPTDVPDFGISADAPAPADLPAPAAAPAATLDDLDEADGDDTIDPIEQLRTEHAKVERLENEVAALTARVTLLSEGDLAAQVVALETDLAAARNLSALHHQNWAEANNKVINYKKQLDRLKKIAGVDSYADIAGRITPAPRG